MSYLDPVVADAFRSEFVRCWHAKTDGSDSSTFHSNCDGKGPTVTIIQSGDYIFGGYTDVSWRSKYLSVIFKGQKCFLHYFFVTIVFILNAECTFASVSGASSA